MFPPKLFVEGLDAFRFFFEQVPCQSCTVLYIDYNSRYFFLLYLVLTAGTTINFVSHLVCVEPLKMTPFKRLDIFTLSYLWHSEYFIVVA